MTGLKFARTGVLLAALAIGASPSHAAVSPFRALAGAWTGGGMVSMADGQQEPLRCRAAYEVGGSGDQLRLNLRCASSSYTIDLSSDAEYRGGEISGSWTESSHNASGSLSGRGSGEHIEIAAQGQSFSASLSVTTRGNRQSVSIRPQAGTPVQAVSLSLSRR